MKRCCAFYPKRSTVLLPLCDSFAGEPHGIKLWQFTVSPRRISLSASRNESSPSSRHFSLLFISRRERYWFVMRPNPLSRRDLLKGMLGASALTLGGCATHANKPEVSSF